MSKVADIIIATLRDAQAPENGWRAASLRKACGLPAQPFAEAVQSLRFAGKMRFDAWALSPSMMPVAVEALVETACGPIVAEYMDKAGVDPVEFFDRTTLTVETGGTDVAALRAAVEAVGADARLLPPLASVVQAEAQEAVRRRTAARKTSQVTRKSQYLPVERPSLGAQMIDIAMRDDPAMMMISLQRRWPELWAMVRTSAERAGERPMQAMVRLLEAGLKAEGMLP